MTISSDNVTLAIAILGASLGLLNSYRSLFKDRVRIRVKASRYVMCQRYGSSSTGLSVEVVNIGFIAVSISGFYIEMEKTKDIMVDLKMISSDGKWNLPKRLEPKESTTIYFSPEFEEDIRLKNGSCVLVKTACGKSTKNKSKAFKSWIKSIKERAEQVSAGNRGQAPLH